MQQVTTRNDPAPSRLTYRLQRLMLTPLFRILLRVGVPFCVTFTVATVYLSDAGRQEAIQTAIADLRKQIETRPEFMVNELTVEGASAGVEDDIREIFPFDLPSSSFDIDLEHVRNMIVGLPAVAEASVRVRQGGVLVAQVKEREPVVVWRTWDGLGLVDKDGYVVSEIASRLERADLPAITGKSARWPLIRGSKSRPLPSGMTTSVITRSPSPCWTHCQSVSALPVARVSSPSRCSARSMTVRMERSSSAIRTFIRLVSLGHKQIFGNKNHS